ncbi:hypothetical protein BMJ34_19885 [Sinorhizobium medicae]|uniref:hypothetical protein n=1 Tax=Sinorhizobium medicae TaxID=110321 RepID=UPI000C7A2BAE|nr:hypothetical protein [Sinorhizobium medicae]PLT96128.1 hypothetical protein BMJ34_19885 [Sinorhizobium medicae]PLU20813.1 hypothetical protein BMJ30_07315 [Sinorhizobium medicae]
MSETSSGTVYIPSSILDGREHRRNDRSFSKVIASVGADTVIIPGHGKPLSTLDDLKDYHEMLATIRDNVARLKSAGRPVEETVAAAVVVLSIMRGGLISAIVLLFEAWSKQPNSSKKKRIM